MLQHLIGLEPDLPRDTLRVSPALLPWLNELHFANIELGPHRLDVRLWRSNGEVRCEVSGADGLNVEVTPVSG
jgi:hypothetical protein